MMDFLDNVVSGQHQLPVGSLPCGHKIFLTGGCGFIGSWVAEALVERGYDVVVFDNLSSGKLEFVEHLTERNDFKLLERDLLKDELSAVKGCDVVFHLAANPDVRIGADDTKVHLDQNVLATYNVLEAMRAYDVKQLVFTSTSTVYGEATELPTPEHYGPLIPISLYGASKLACEALISAYCHSFGMRAVIYRFANVVGPRSTHGVIYDFINKLRNDPDELLILGDGRQTKSYCHISDCVEAILFGWEKTEETVAIFNIGSEDWVDVRTIADIVSEEMGLHPRYRFTGGKRGWAGDVPTMLLAIAKLKELGWSPENDSKASIIATVKALLGE